MKLTWGSYEHQDDSVSFRVSLRTKRDPIMQRRGTDITYHITGVMTGTSQADLTVKLNALESAYASDGQNLIFYDNANNPTVHSLLTANAFGGTKVADFRYLEGNPRVWGSGTEYVFKRTYQVVVAAQVFFNVGIIRWEESVWVVGNGGPRFTYMESLTGVPKKQELVQQTTQWAYQEGFAIHDSLEPTAASPIWPTFEHQDRRMIKKFTPRFGVGGAQVDFGKKWRYVFSSPSAFTGGPTPVP